MAAFTIRTSPEVEASEPLRALVRTAEPVLAEVVRDSTEPGTAVWRSLRDESNRPVLTLTLADEFGEVTWVWTADGFETERWLRIYLRGQWGELLALRAAALIRQASKPVSDPEPALVGGGV